MKILKAVNHAGLLSVSLLLFSTTAAAAHGPGRGDHRPPDMQQRMERLADDLDLTAEQREALREVMEASALEREALREKIEQQFQPEMCAIHLNTKEQIRNILTAEQAAELEGRMQGWADAAGDRDHRKGQRRHDFLSECETEG